MTHHLIVSRHLSGPRSVMAWGDFDRLFASVWHGFVVATRACAFAPPIDVTEAELRVAAALPGFGEREIEVYLEDGVLTIRGEPAEASEPPTPTLRHAGTLLGGFRRSLRLPAGFDADAARAVYRDGILTVALPKGPAPEVRAIPVTTPREGGKRDDR